MKNLKNKKTVNMKLDKITRTSRNVLKQKFFVRLYHKTNVNKGLNDIISYIPGYTYLTETVKPVITEVSVGMLGVGMILGAGYVGGIDPLDTVICATAAVAGHYIKYTKEKSSIEDESDVSNTEPTNSIETQLELSEIKNNLRETNSIIPDILNSVENLSNKIDASSKMAQNNVNSNYEQTLTIIERVERMEEDLLISRLQSYFEIDTINNRQESAVTALPSKNQLLKDFALYMEMCKTEDLNEDGSEQYDDKLNVVVKVGKSKEDQILFDRIQKLKNDSTVNIEVDEVNNVAINALNNYRREVSQLFQNYESNTINSKIFLKINK